MPPIVLKWSGSIASRGKFKGKKIPVLDKKEIESLKKPKKRKVVEYPDNQIAFQIEQKPKIEKKRKIEKVEKIEKVIESKELTRFVTDSNSQPINLNDDNLQALTIIDPITNNENDEDIIEIPRNLSNEFDLKFSHFSYLASHIYTTDISSSCSKLLSKLLEVSFKDPKISYLMNDVCDVLATDDDDKQISIIKRGKHSYNLDEAFLTSTLLTHFLTITSYGTIQMSRRLKKIKHEYDLKGGISLAFENPELSIWVKLNCWFDCIHSLMVGRMPYFSKFDKDFLFNEEFSNNSDHNSDLFAVVGCTDIVASKLLDLSYIVGHYGFKAFENESNIKFEDWNKIEEILLFLHSLESSIHQKQPKESLKSFQNRMCMYDIWKWGGLLYIYTIIYRKPNNSYIVKSIRDKILFIFSQFSDALASKQALWSFFLACSEVSEDEIDLHVQTLNLLDKWYETTNLGCFKTHIDVLLEIWNKNKETDGRVKWWELLEEKFNNGEGELVFS